MMNKNFNQEHIIGIICIAIGTVVISLTRTFPGGTDAINISGPAFFPIILSYILIGLGVMQIFTGIFSKEEGFATAKDIWKGIKTKEFVNLLVMIALLIFFITMVEVLGFLSTSGVFLVIVLWRLGVPWLRNLIYTAVFLAIIHLVFRMIFSVTLPSGFLI